MGDGGRGPRSSSSFLSAAIGIAALSAAVAGHMFRPLDWPKRCLLALAAISPNLTVSATTSVLLIGLAVWDRRGARGLARAASLEPSRERP